MIGYDKWERETKDSTFNSSTSDYSEVLLNEVPPEYILLANQMAAD